MTLTNALQRAYADRCRQDPRSGEWSFAVDDRRPDDVYPGFCTITAAVRPGGGLTLTLAHPPLNDEVRVAVDDHRGRVQTHPITAVVLDLPAAGSAAAAVRDLAAAIKGVTRKGQRYPEKNWKWIVPRTVGALDRFARLLTRHYRTRERETGR